jgi:hypothetical protein
VRELEERVQGLGVEATQALSADQKQRLFDLGKDLKRLWDQPQVPVELKKRVLRTMIEEITVSTHEEPAEEALGLKS